MTDRAGMDKAADGFVVNQTLGSYIHLHFGSCPQVARHFVNTCGRWTAEKKATLKEPYMKPHEIEQLSFQMIDSEAGNHGFSTDQWPVVRRVIHTSADFEWPQMIRFHPQAISSGVSAIRNGCPILPTPTWRVPVSASGIWLGSAAR